MSYKIEEIEGIGPAYGQKLATAGVKTTDDFLKLCSDATGRKKVALTTGIDETLLLKWANMADLMRINGIGGEYAELLEASGVDTIKELRTRVADNLAQKAAQINEVKRLTRVVPSSKVIADWIEKAKTLEPSITH